MLWPLFARAPSHWFLEIFLLSSPSVQSFFLLRPVGRRDLSAGPEQKNNTTQGVFFAPAPAKGRGRSAPLGAGTGPEQKRKHWPHRKVAALNGAQKKTYSAHPGTTAKRFLETNDTGHERKGATTQQKKNDSLTAALDRDAHSLLFRGDFSGRARLVFFFFAAAPRGRSLTHCGPGRRCLPPGW